MVLALAAIQRGDHHKTRVWLLATALLGMTFIAGQIYEFTIFVQEGFTVRSSPAGSAFFVLTSFHGAHVTIGILMLLSLVAMSLRGALPQSRHTTVEYVGLYWHFVDIVWIIIFTIIYLSRAKERSWSPTSRTHRPATPSTRAPRSSILIPNRGRT